jgi:predicted Ser/Thr protein kinase
VLENKSEPWTPEEYAETKASLVIPKNKNFTFRIPSVELIMAKYSENKETLSLTEFQRFIEDYPEALRRFLEVFHEASWKDPIEQTSDRTPSLHLANSEAPICYAGSLTIHTETQRSCWVVLHNQILKLYSSSNSGIFDALYLNDCSIKMGVTTCSIFQLNAMAPRLEFSTDNREEFAKWISLIKLSGGMKRFVDKFDLGDRIGHGKFSDVFYALEKNSDQKYAIKLIKRKKRDLRDREMLQTEVNILQMLDHQNIIKLLNRYSNTTYEFLLQELVKGEDWFELMKVLTECEIKMIVKHLLDALEYMHAMGIIHRDIKLENILCQRLEKNFTIKVIDFGLAAFILPGHYCKSACGTVAYAAPELINREFYNQSVDMWSVGVSVYVLLTKKFPFPGANNDQIIEKLNHSAVDYSDFRNFSPDAEDFVRKLMERDPQKRMTASEALHHSWLQ